VSENVYQAPQPEKKKMSGLAIGLIVGAIVLVLIGCCGCGLFGLFALGSLDSDVLESILDDEAIDSGADSGLIIDEREFVSLENYFKVKDGDLIKEGMSYSEVQALFKGVPPLGTYMNPDDDSYVSIWGTEDEKTAAVSFYHDNDEVSSVYYFDNKETGE